MNKKIFVSYNFKDREPAHNVRPFFNRQGGRCQGEPVYVENDVSAQGEAAIREEILRILEPCVGVLFVVGDDSHNSPWIDWEAKMAIRRGLPMVAVQLPNKTGGMPNRLKDLEVPFVAWGQETLCDALNRIDHTRKSM